MTSRFDVIVNEVEWIFNPSMWQNTGVDQVVEVYLIENFSRDEVTDDLIDGILFRCVEDPML